AASGTTTAVGSTKKQRIKIVPVGDGTVGKTTLSLCFKENRPLKEEFYIATIFDNINCEKRLDNTLYQIEIWDTAGQEDYDKLRPLAYEMTDVVLFIFDTTEPSTLRNIKDKWLKEIARYVDNPRVVKILVENKCDLPRNCDNEVDRKLLLELRPNFDDFIETSGKTMQGVNKLFENAIRIFEQRRSSQKQGCAKFLTSCLNR
ncbi:MAG: hypothetical protein MHMPM18_004347, partial [Marteilia pararefringens]